VPLILGNSGSTWRRSQWPHDPARTVRDMSNDTVLSRYADNSTTPNFYLTAEQRHALDQWLDGRSENLGVLSLGEGYVKVTLHGAEGEVLDTHLIQAQYPPL
jgi:hypothetical protein